jgi:hypothetical protein
VGDPQIGEHRAHLAGQARRELDREREAVARTLVRG